MAHVSVSSFLAMGASLSTAVSIPAVLAAKDDSSSRFLSRHDAFIFDCDGVLWHGARGIEGARETILGLRGSGRKVLFVTNNSTKAREDYVKTFKDRLDIDVRQEDVIAASWAAAAFLKQCSDKRARKPKIMLVGMSGLTTELRYAGYEVVGGPDFNGKTIEDLERELDIDDLDDDVGVVVTGLDKDLNYYKIAMAAAYVHKGCLFVASNTDATLPMKPNGTFGPGAGLSCAAVLNTVGRETVDAVAGKPSALLGATVCDSFGLDPTRTCMIGDRLDTDMLFAHNAGFSKLLVLSGVCDQDAVDGNQDFRTSPDFVASSVAVIAQLLEEGE